MRLQPSRVGRRILFLAGGYAVLHLHGPDRRAKQSRHQLRGKLSVWIPGFLLRSIPAAIGGMARGGSGAIAAREMAAKSGGAPGVVLRPQRTIRTAPQIGQLRRDLGACRSHLPGPRRRLALLPGEWERDASSWLW